jgi:bacterioferritin
MDTNAKPQPGKSENPSNSGKSETKGGDSFSVDIKQLRANARRNLEQGVITESYTANRQEVLKMLNEALSTELVCVLRYKRHHFVASGIHGESVAKEFAAHAAEEQQHADQIAGRIIQLGGDPDFCPDRLTQKSHAEYSEATDLRTMIEDNLVAERIAIDSYRAMIRYLSDRDPTTRRMIEEILAVEEEHAKDMADLLEPSSGDKDGGTKKVN